MYIYIYMCVSCVYKYYFKNLSFTTLLLFPLQLLVSKSES